MHAILPVTDLTIDLHARTLHFCAQRGIVPLTQDSGRVLVAAMVDDEINHRLHWTDPSDNIMQALGETVSWWLPERYLTGKTREAEVCREYYQTVIDRFVGRVSEVMDFFMSPLNTEEMWHVWYTMSLGEDLILEKGEDYRIIEFERQVLQGAIPVPPKIGNKIRSKHFGRLV